MQSCSRRIQEWHVNVMESPEWSDKIRHFCQFKRSHEEGYRFLAASITADDFVSAVLVSPVDDQVTWLQIYLIFGVSIAFLSQTENVSKNRWMETHLQSNKFLLALTHTPGEWTTDAFFDKRSIASCSLHLGCWRRKVCCNFSVLASL